MKKRRRATTAVAALVAGLLGATAPIAHAQQPHYYILIGGTCDGDATVYNLAWLRGGIPRIVHYPAGGEGLCNGNTPMDQSVAQGYEEAKRVVRAAYSENPDALFTVVGYSQGAIVGNQVLNDIADDELGVNKSRFSAKFYADPMQPETGISARFPPGTRLPPPGSGYVSYGPGRTQFNGIQFIRYCIQTDGICDFTSREAPGGYFAQHFCYPRTRPADRRSIMGDTIADKVYTNASEWLQKAGLPQRGAAAGRPIFMVIKHATVGAESISGATCETISTGSPKPDRTAWCLAGPNDGQTTTSQSQESHRNHPGRARRSRPRPTARAGWGRQQQPPVPPGTVVVNCACTPPRSPS